ncbi:MAG: CvpA family protein, partial [Mucinivorans sp.]
MNLLDLVIFLALVYALAKGFFSGLLVQLSGIAGLVLGVWAATKFSHAIGQWMALEQTTSKEVVFVLVVVVVLFGVIVLLRLLNQILSWGGLSGPIKVLGAIFSAVKMVLILALALKMFIQANNIFKMVDSTENLESSYCYKPLLKISDWVFPFIENLSSQVYTPTIEDKIKQTLHIDTIRARSGRALINSIDSSKLLS